MNAVVRVKAKVYLDNTGNYIQIPVLLTKDGILKPLLEYTIDRFNKRSLSWFNQLFLVVTKFMEYLDVHPGEKDPRKTFGNFALSLQYGTVDDDGNDPSGLYWKPRISQARTLILNLSEFFDYVSDERNLPKVNPPDTSNRYNELLAEKAYQHRRNKAFLGHTWDIHNRDSLPRSVFVKAKPKLEVVNPPAFPEERFKDLLFKGFKTRDVFDYRGMLITILIHGAGFRLSEAFHLYFDDVKMYKDEPIVEIYHPEYGTAPKTWKDALGHQKKGNRLEYLREQYGMQPRNVMMGSNHAGWKGGTHNSDTNGAKYFKKAYFFPESYGDLFVAIWKLYLKQVASIQSLGHPFAFVNLGDKEGTLYKINKYQKAHKRACEKIGLVSLKSNGTTPHGHRHAYGQRIDSAGFSKEYIRRFLHHSSIESQDVYTAKKRMKQVRDALKEASKKVNGIDVDNGDLL